MQHKNMKGNLIEKFAAYIVDHRKQLLVIFLVAAIVCAFTSTLTRTNDKLEEYLDEDTDTRQGLTVMDNEFTTYGTAEIMVTNMTFAQAEEIAEKIEAIEGVKEVVFDDSADHSWNSYSLMNVTFSGDKDSKVSRDALAEIKTLLKDYDSYLSTEVGNPLKTIISREMLVVDLIAFCIIVIVLLLTSSTYAEILVFLITFGAAAIYNMGTNFLMGEISYVTDSIAVVLQLALAMDYAIILCHRYLEEHDGNGLAPREAIIAALSKAIPEIAGSSLTTVSGLLALTFMKYNLGADMGFVLIKAILISLLCVFTVMPVMLILFSGLIDRTHHRSYMPKIPFLSRFVYRTRKIVPPLFLVVFVLATVFVGKVHYVYDQNSVNSIRHNEIQKAEQKIESVFGSTTQFAIIVPTGNGDGERAIVQEVKALDKTKSVTGLSDIEATDEYNLLDELNPRQFSELAGIDYEVAALLYRSYALENEEFGLALTSIDNYRIPLLDIFNYLLENRDKVYIELDDDDEKKLDDLQEELDEGQKQLRSQDWSRIVVEADIPSEGDESYAYLDSLKAIAAKSYSTYHVVGTTTSCSDLKASFADDNRLISILSVAFVAVILLLTYKSAGLPILLLLIIQGSINLNFASSVLTHSNVFFVTYLIITSIQMGANIDYAIVISGRYLEYRKRMDIREAMSAALETAFPTVFSSGTMLTSAGFVIMLMTSNETISAVGLYLGKGTLISMLLVLGVLPQIIMLGDALIHKTTFTLESDVPVVEHSGRLQLDGHVKGYISGYIDGEIHASFKGDIKATVEMDTPNLSEEKELTYEVETDL